MKRGRFATYAWGVLAYNLAVIIWGAYVRATSSGDGCGSHWPLCNGEVIPRVPKVQTLIEFTHRITSGLSLILVLLLVVWAFRRYAKGHLVRYGAAVSLFFILTEALIGRGLVIFRLVAGNASVMRALYMSLHLSNTFLLLAALALTAWWAAGGRPLQLNGQPVLTWALAIGLLGLVVLGISGAIAALGDTLFPAKSVAEGLKQDFSPVAHFLVRLRLWHPLLAILTGLYVIFLAVLVSLTRPSPTTAWLARLQGGLFLLQLGVGALNVILLAPVWMQLIHLLIADLVWISFVLCSASALAIEAPQLKATEPRAGWKGILASRL